MKCQVLIILSAIGVLDVFAITTSFGEIKPRDLLVFDQFFHQKAVPGRSHIESFEFTSKHGEKISAIHVTDLTHKQDGGQFRIYCGGVGYTFVKFQTISECTRQVLLNIEIFVTGLKPLKHISEISSEQVRDLSLDLNGRIH